MKYYLIVVFLVGWMGVGVAQKHDHVWLLGYSSNTIDSTFGGTRIDFNSSEPSISYEFREMDFRVANSSMCDAIGNLLFYTNGIYIANYLNQKIPGSDTLNPGNIHEEFAEYGYPLTQGVLILPHPDSSELFFLFHARRQKPFFNGLTNSSVDRLAYTLVDMSMNNGKGGIRQKGIEILNDTLSTTGITSVRHSNGKDWWILFREYKAQRYHRLLFTGEEVLYIGDQSIGVAPYSLEVLGQEVFSPDGSKFVRYGTHSEAIGSYLEYFDFDRCTGLLSNPVAIVHIDSAGAAGAAFSPNSRFLYCSSSRYVYQYDTWAEDFAASKDTVAVYDGFLSPFSTNFFMAQLAPNGKIYLNSSNSNNVLHVIHQPDLKGDACQFEQHGVQLPTYNAFSLPNFPNYRLGAVPVPVPSFTYQVLGDSVFFQSTSVNGEAFEWDFGDGGTATGEAVYHVYEQLGSYEVSLNVRQDCLEEVAVETVVVGPTGIEEQGQKMANEFQAYPNPARHEVNLDFEARDSKGLLVVNDLLGRVVLEIQIPENTTSLVVKTADWQQGVYQFGLSFGAEPKEVKPIVIVK